MSDNDRERWNAIWGERAAEPAPPARFLVAHAAHLPVSGRALDLAGGAGRHAIWLAQRGLDVTMLDISEVAIDLAERRAAEAHVSIRVQRTDLEAAEPALPAGPFDLILCWHFLHRGLRQACLPLLADRGIFILAQPTRTNLERHERPSARFLVEPDELSTFARAAGLDLLVDFVGWNDEGRHEAAIIARKS